MFNRVPYAKLTPTAKPPFRKHPTDAGLDFYSDEDVHIGPHFRAIVHTGIAILIPKGRALVLKPKSRNDHLIGAGVIDTYYEPGEILVKVINYTDDEMYIKKGDAIAQGLYTYIDTPDPYEVPLEFFNKNSTRSGTGGIVEQLQAVMPSRSMTYEDDDFEPENFYIPGS
jgi:dUTP pyrophosphatase